MPGRFPRFLVLALALIVSPLNIGLSNAGTLHAATPSKAAPDTPKQAAPSANIPVPGLQYPNALAVNSGTHRLYITSRNNNSLLMLDSVTLQVLKVQPNAGSSPWGVEVDTLYNKVYVASFSGGEVRVFNGATLDLLHTISISLGAELTFLVHDALRSQIYAASHRDNRLYVIDTNTDTIVANVTTGGMGAWGLAPDPLLNRVYVGHRDTRNIIALDGNNGWQPIWEQQLEPCTPNGQPYALAMNYNNNRLFVACAFSGNVTQVRMFNAVAGGFTYQATVGLDPGGSDGGGGIAVNYMTDNVFVTNSGSDTVTVIDRYNAFVKTVAARINPFGIVADPDNNRIVVANRISNDLTLIADAAAGPPPLISLSPGNYCQGRRVTVSGSRFPYDPARGVGHVAIDVGATRVAMVDVSPSGTFSNLGFDVPGGLSGTVNVLAHDLVQTSAQALAPLRTPRTDLPIIFVPGLAGSELLAGHSFAYNTHYGLQGFFYPQGVPIWLSNDGLVNAFTGHSAYFEPLALLPDGKSARPDLFGYLPDVVVGGPLRTIGFQLPWGSQIQLTNVYKGFFEYLQSQGYGEGTRLFYLPFDWRRDLVETDALLDNKIHEVMNLTGKDKVVIITHSTGGLVTRYYLLKHGTAHVDQFISLGTPYTGLIQPVQAIETGIDLGMGWHMGRLGVGLDPAVVWDITQNWPAVYQLSPAALWFQDAGLGERYDPRYLVRSRLQIPGGLTSEPLDYPATIAWLSGRHNAALESAGVAYQGAGIGDMSRLTDQYYGQRIAGSAVPTVGHLSYSPREVCATICLPWPFNKCWTPCVPLGETATPKLDLFGDDTVAVRSAIGANRPADDTRFYFVGEVHHMDLPANGYVQSLVGAMLSGQLYSLTQLATGGSPSNGAGAADGAFLSAQTGDSPPTLDASGTQLTLYGTADLNVFDAAGHHTGPISGQPGAAENEVEHVTFLGGQGVQTAMITAGGPYTIIISGTQASGAAMLRVSPMSEGEIAQTMLFAGIPITSTTVATLAMPGPGLPPGDLSVHYADGWPPLPIAGSLLTGAANDDITPPSGTVTIDRATRLVTITAFDDTNGSGVAEVLYSTESVPANYVPYGGPFVLPPGLGPVTAVATDHAGNTGPAGFAQLTWAPLIIR